MKKRNGKRQSRKSEEKAREEKKRKKIKENQGAQKYRKVAKHVGVPMIRGSGGSTSRLTKAAGAEPSPQMRDESCRPLWREARFQVQSVKS